MAYYGIDLHTNSFVSMRLTFESGLDKGTITTAKHYLDPASFKKFKNELSKEDYVIVEACANAFWFHDEIKGLVKECYVLDVNKYKASINKTDKIDTKKLTKKLAFYVITKGDNEDLPLVYVPQKEVRELRALFTTYKLNKKIITQLKCRIHSIFTENGIDIPKKQVANPENRAKLLGLSLGEIWKQQLKILYSQLDTIEQETEQMKKLIYELGYRLFPEEIEILLSIRGFSPLTAIALMSDIVDINRFPSVKKFCAYLRTAPRVKSSNDKTVIGPTNRYSRSLTCTLMSQSVEHFAVAGEYLGTFYERVKKGKKAGVYRMALIRKILVCAYYMLKRKTKFYWVEEKLYQEKLRDFRKIVNPTAIKKTTKKAVA
jgi:transposase